MKKGTSGVVGKNEEGKKLGLQVNPKNE